MISRAAQDQFNDPQPVLSLRAERMIDKRVTAAIEVIAAGQDLALSIREGQHDIGLGPKAARGNIENQRLPLTGHEAELFRVTRLAMDAPDADRQMLEN